MKIMYIIKSFAMKAGVERVMSDKMNYLAAHGYDVVLVTYEQGDHSLAFPLNQKVVHHSLDARFFTLSRWPIWKRPYYWHKMRQRLKCGLQEVVDNEKPDVMITTTYSMKVLDIILGVNTSAHRLIESHVACYTVRKAYDYAQHTFLFQLAKLYDEYVFRKIRRFERLIVLTSGDATDWKEYIEHVDIIPNPVTAYPEEVMPHDGSGHRIIAVGRLHEQKGFDMLINAFAKVADLCPEWHIDIYGHGDDEQLLLDMINAKKLDGRIKILPPTEHIYDEYQKSEFYVLSSRYEGYPLVLNEAMSCGIPCVAFRCKYGPEDAIEHQVNGLLVENGNIMELAQQILWMTTHVKKRIAMGHAARLAAQRYLPETIMQKWIALFNSLM